MDLTIEHVCNKIAKVTLVGLAHHQGTSTNRRNGGMKHAPPPSITGKEPMTDIDIALFPRFDRKLNITAPVNNDKSDNSNNTTNKEVKPSASLSPQNDRHHHPLSTCRPHSPWAVPRKTSKGNNKILEYHR